MNNLSLKFMLWVFAVALAVSQAPAQGYLICPLPDALSGGGTTSQFDPSWNTNLATGQKIIPIVFHLIGTSASLQDIHIQSALNQLNADFNSSNLDWDIEFRLAGIGPRGECTTGVTRYPGITSQDPSVVKAATRWDNTKYLNVWVLPLIEGDPLKWGVVSAQPSKFQVRGIRFLGCNFINGTTHLLSHTQYGIGILARESSFNVGDYCTGSSLPCPSASQDHCLFKNLYKGIWATKTDIDPGLPHRYSVTNATFDECWTGIQSSQGSRCYIVGNQFELGDINTDAFLSSGYITGLYMDWGHTNITMQENLFKLDDNAPTDIQDTHILFGTDIFYIGQANNAIRRNTYKNLSSGNQAFGEGAEPLQTTGLHYLCNTNENNVLYVGNFLNNASCDFNVLQVMVPLPPPGLRSVQGGIDPNFGVPISAGNTFSHVNALESDFSYRAAAGIRYFFPNGVIPETPLTFTPPPKIVLQTNTPANNCESILCNYPPCRSQEQLAAGKQAIGPAKTQYNDLRSLYLSNPTGPDAQTQMSSMTALQEIIQGNTFDILTDILANETGTLSDYRYWLGNMDAYETDLELVRSYIGTAELSAAVAKLNALPSKYQLSGDLSAEFNQYQALLGIVNQHYQAGGNKYSFSTATLSTFQGYAENSPHARVRGLAKQILAIYGITYPPEPSSGFGGGGEERQGGQSVLPVKRVQLVPNPANQTVKVQVDKNLANADIAVLVTVVSTIGATVIERNFNASSEYFDLDISGLRAGVYYVWVRLGSGESFVHPLSVVR